jgi:integrase/recombinase XerD
MQQSATRTAEEALPENMFRRANGILYGRIEVDGREVRKSLSTSDLVEAEARLRRWRAEVSPRFEHTELTFAQVASSWIEAYEHQHTLKTWRRYKTSLRMLAPHFGEKLWAEITRPQLVAYMNERKKTASNATINRDLAVMSNIFEHAIDQGWAEENPVLKLSKKARKERRDPFTLPTDEMVEAAFARMHSTFGELCRFALLTGMRKDEIVFLKWRDVDLDRKAVQLFITKNRTVRVVPLSDEAVELLRRRNHREGYVFVTREGGHYQRVTEMWREIMIRTIKKWSDQHPDHHPDHPYTRFRFHDLRHLFAIRYLRNGGNLYDLQKILGHSTIRQTEEYLQYLTPAQQARAQGSDQQPDHSAVVLQFDRAGKAN